MNLLILLLAFAQPDPPLAPVTDLAIAGHTSSEVTLTWTAPLIPPGYHVEFYEFHMSVDGPIDQDYMDSHEPVGRKNAEMPPFPPVESFTITDLNIEEGTTCAFALRIRYWYPDEEVGASFPAWSDPSNNALIQDDSIPPPPIDEEVVATHDETKGSMCGLGAGGGTGAVALVGAVYVMTRLRLRKSLSVCSSSFSAFWR